MGNLTPVITQAAGFGIGGPVGTSLSAVLQNRDSRTAQKEEQDLAMRQLQARQRSQQQSLEAETALEKERIAAGAAAEEETRRAALRRAVARQRAQFGASGIGNGNDGSTRAVLLGLFDETEDELAERERLDTLRQKALDLDVSTNRSLNVLQQSQLAERQSLEKIKSFF